MDLYTQAHVTQVMLISLLNGLLAGASLSAIGKRVWRRITHAKVVVLGNRKTAWGSGLKRVV